MGLVGQRADQGQDWAFARGKRAGAGASAVGVAPPDRPGKPGETGQRRGIKSGRLDRVAAKRADGFGLLEGGGGGGAKAEDGRAWHEAEAV